MRALKLTPPPSEAQALAEAGMRAAGEHADAVHDGWRKLAYKVVEDYVRTRVVGVAEFTAEDVREYSRQCRLAEPPDRRAWGGIMLKAARAGLIERTGYRSHRDRSRHGAPSTTWMKVIPF